MRQFMPRKYLHLYEGGIQRIEDKRGFIICQVKVRAPTIRTIVSILLSFVQKSADTQEYISPPANEYHETFDTLL